MTIDLSKISGKDKTASWYDVRNGRISGMVVLPNQTGNYTFQPPSKEQDWVLVIDDASKEFDPPGKPIEN